MGQLVYHNTSLLTPSVEVDFSISNRSTILAALEDRLRAEMLEHNGLGIAAPQVGVNYRAMIVNNTFMVNPVLLGGINEVETMNEGCLSFPHLFVAVDRYKEVEIGYSDLSGNTKNEYLKGIDARCFQHELDHLDGKVFFKDATRYALIRAIQKAEKRGYRYSLEQLRKFQQ